jgi:hypothetical protein
MDGLLRKRSMRSLERAVTVERLEQRQLLSASIHPLFGRGPGGFNQVLIELDRIQPDAVGGADGAGHRCDHAWVF